MDGILYGRDGVVETLARTEAPLTFVTGDSGVGKTSVLEAAAAPRSGWYNASPRRFAASTGAVQQGVLDSLANVVAAIIEERGEAAEIGERLAGAAERLLKDQAREFGRVIGAELLEIVRSRLGPQFGNALMQYVHKLREEVDASVAARIAAARDESTADVLGAFCTEVASAAGDARIGLSFDLGERLIDDEARILVDLSERVGDTCHLRVAFATDGGPVTARLAELCLLAPVIHQIEVGPLDEDAVGAWLAAAGLEVDPRAAIKATGGYPLHLGDLVHDLEQGGRIDDLPQNEQVARRSEAAWNALSPSARTVARKLCVLDDPLPFARLVGLADLDVAGFADAVDELARGRIFPVEVEGHPWFHEQRRAFVRHKLHASELNDAATRAADAVWEELAHTGERSRVVQFAALAGDSRTLQEQDPKLAAALTLDESEHAVMAAILELATPGSHGAADAQQLFRHARRFTDVVLDPIALLSALEAAGLVVTASNDYATVVVPVLTPRAVTVIDGSADRRLNRSPIPQLSTLVFDIALRPRIGAFSQARFGIGRPSLGGLARTAGGGEADAGYGRQNPNRREPGIHALVRFLYGDVPFWLVATFDDEEARAGGIRELADLEVEIFGEQLHVVDLHDHPMSVIPEQRFAKAAARATGLTSGPYAGDVRETGEIKVSLEPSLPAENRYELRVETAKRLRMLATDLEREAMELDETFGLYWDEQDRARIECTVYGGEERAVRADGLLARATDQRYLFFQIEQDLALPVNATPRHVTEHWGTPESVDPVFAEIGNRRTRAFAFNSAQPRRRVVLDFATLEEMTRNGFLRLMSDARALADLMVRDTVPLPPTALYVYVLLEPPTPGWKPGCGSKVVALERESETGDDEVYFAISEGGLDLTAGMPLATGDIAALFEDTFGFAPARHAAGFLLDNRAHNVETLLSEYGGFHDDDLDPRWPDEDS